MLYTFRPEIQAGLAAGKYIPVISKAGVPLSMVRDASTGHIAAHAIGVDTNPLTAITSLIGVPNLQQGNMIASSVKTLSASVATLQATTALIGVGMAATGVITAVNLWQTLKLRQDVKQMRLEIQDGFLNLHKALADQEEEILRHIDRVADDVEFRTHRTILVRAYGKFKTALNRLQTASSLRDAGQRNDEIAAARTMLFDALADYNNDQLMQGVSPAAYLRRRECVWAIEQAIAMTFQIQNEYSAVHDRLICLDGTIRADAARAIKGIEHQEELDFFFPEILRIHDHDLATINAWREHIDWYQSLSSHEQQEIKELALETQSEDNLSEGQIAELKIPPEYIYYEEVQEYSHAELLKDSLEILVDPEIRAEYEEYIAERSLAAGLSTLTVDNLQQASPVTLSNLECYFTIQDNSEERDDDALVATEVC